MTRRKLNSGNTPPQPVPHATPPSNAPLQAEAQTSSLQVKAEALDASPLPVALADLEGRLTHINPAYVKLWGLTRATDVLGHPASEAWDDPQAGAKAMNLAREQGTWEGYLFGKHKDGSTFPVRVLGSLIRDGAGSPVALMGCFVDMREQRRTEQELRESQQMLQTVLDTIPVRVFWKDRESKYLGCNRAFAHDAGLNAPDELTGKDDFALGWCEQAERYRIDDRQVIDTGIPKLQYEEPQTTPDGHHIWLRTSKIPLRDLKGSIRGVLGTYEDITERKQAEEALRQSEERFRSIITHTPNVAVEIYDDTGRVLFWSPAATTMFGFTPAQALGKPLDQLFLSAEAAREFSRVLQDVGHTGTAQGPSEWTCELPSGETKIVLSTIFLLPGNAERKCFVCMDVDITAHKRATEALRLSEERLRTVLHVCPLPIAWADARGRIEFVNRRFSEVLGYTILDVPTLDDWFVRAYPDPECRRVIMASWAAEVETARNTVEPIGPVEYQVTCKDGTVRQIELVGRLLTEGLVVIFNDLTDRKRTEEERAKLREQLLQSQKMESVGRLAGGVAHDFNNLLSPILGYAELLMEDYPSSDPRHEMVEQIEHAAKRARELSRQLLAFSRKQILDLKATDLRTIATTFEKMLRATIREDIRIELSLPQSLGLVRADVVQIEQVLMNLALNAQDAMPTGGTLSISLSDVLVKDIDLDDPNTIPPGCYVTLTVSDAGCGMDKATLDRLFEPFFTTKETGRGTGLGLSTAYGIVRQHGGYIQVYSKPGVGSTFRIYLPRVTETVTKTAETPPPPPPPRGGKETIMVVEDNSMVREVICRMLVRLGYRVEPAETPGRGIEIMEREMERIDLLLTDVIMPEMNGRELYDQLRALRPGLRVIFMSGYDSDVVANRGLLQEGVRLLQKPFEAALLSETIRKALEK
ncbi:MAG: hypothetical protein A3K19_20230 [Lentisphaerae bacterium RIFOXYB12_FULL_65_16]|nr:MAG: hypothetical protein A3K19_20230 [Lentisphaerae bacterium RIFOXYB12_FULL_65_16]